MSIERLLDQIEWRELPETTAAPDELYATHEGVLEIGDLRLRCYTLNNHERVFHADDIAAFLSGEKA